MRRLLDEAAALRRAKQLHEERLAAAEADRKTLFTEAQTVEAAVRGAKARKVEAQAQASHYRDLLSSQM